MTTDDTKSRLREILTSPEATGRKGLAHHLAFETELDVAQCQKILNAAPQDQNEVLEKSVEKQNAKVLPFTQKSRGGQP